MLALSLPKNVQVTSGENYVCVAGPLGTLVKKSSKVVFLVKDSMIYCLSGDNPALKQTYLSILRSLLLGVTKGYKRKLRLVGVGFKAFLRENTLILKLGFSHEICYTIPKDIKIVCAKHKGTLLVISGIENARVNQIAVEIKRFRIPDIYKGKGIHYNKEKIKLKKGKREGK